MLVAASCLLAACSVKYGGANPAGIEPIAAIWSRSVPASSSRIAADRELIAVDTDFGVTGFAAQTGRAIWTNPAMRGPLLIDDGRLYAFDSRRATVDLLDRRTGQIQWQSSVGLFPNEGRLFSSRRGALVFASPGGIFLVYPYGRVRTLLRDRDEDIDYQSAVVSANMLVAKIVDARGPLVSLISAYNLSNGTLAWQLQGFQFWKMSDTKVAILAASAMAPGTLELDEALTATGVVTSRTTIASTQPTGMAGIESPDAPISDLLWPCFLVDDRSGVFDYRLLRGTERPSRVENAVSVLGTIAHTWFLIKSSTGAFLLRCTSRGNSEKSLLIDKSDLSLVIPSILNTPAFSVFSYAGDVIIASRESLRDATQGCAVALAAGEIDRRSIALLCTTSNRVRLSLFRIRRDRN